MAEETYKSLHKAYQGNVASESKTETVSSITDVEDQSENQDNRQNDVVESMGPDQVGQSLIADEVENIPKTVAVKPFIKAPEVTMTEVLDLDRLLEDLELCGKYRHIVVYATADKAKVLIKTQDALFNALKLCDAIALILQNFLRGATNILEKLGIAYMYLQDGFPDFAMADIESTAKDVNMMKDRCSKTLEDMPGDQCASMIEVVAADHTESKEALPEEVRDDFVSGEMANSLELVAEETHGLDDYTRLVTEDKEQCLAGMIESINEKVDKLPKEGAQSTDGGEDGEGFVIVSSADEVFPSTETVEDVINAFKKIQQPSWSQTFAQWVMSFYTCSGLEAIILALYKYLSRSDLSSGKADKSIAQSEDKSSSSAVVPHDTPRPIDADALKKIDNYMRTKLTLAIIEIVKEKYGAIRNRLKAALDLAEIWYQESKTLVAPAMKHNVDKTSGMSQEEQAEFWQKVDPEFQRKAEDYLRRWKSLKEYCGEHNKKIRDVRRRIEGYYIDNPTPCEAVKRSWDLAAEEAKAEPRVQRVVGEWRSHFEPEEGIGLVVTSSAGHGHE